MENICSNIGVNAVSGECQEPIKKQQHLQVMEVPHEDALPGVPKGVIGIVSADIAAMGLTLALSAAAAKQGIDIQFIQNTPNLPTIDKSYVIKEIDRFIAKPNKVNVIKSSKGKIKYQSNYTPPKKKRKKR